MSNIFSTLFFLVLAVNAIPVHSACEPSEKYLILQPSLGLANRLRAIASASVMAKLSKRKLIIDWQIDDDLESDWRMLFREPKLTFLNESNLMQEGCSREEIFKSDKAFIINPVTEESFYVRLKWMSEIPSYDSDPIIFIQTAQKFEPQEHFLGKAKFEQQYVDFFKSLRPIDAIAQKINELKKEYHFKEKFMVGVHYRAWSTGGADSDVEQDKKGKYINEFIQKMIEAINTHPQETNNKPVAFFLATDDPKIKKKFIENKELQGRIFTREIPIDRQSITGQQDALVDWFLLGDTNYIIGTEGSSFSDEAAHLTKENKKIPIGLKYSGG